MNSQLAILRGPVVPGDQPCLARQISHHHGRAGYAAARRIEDIPPGLPDEDLLLFVGELSTDKCLPTLLLIGRRTPDNGGALPLPGAGTTAVPGRIVSVGRLERYKGHQRVIAALPHVRREIPDAHLLILGSGPYQRDLGRLARELGVSDRVSIRHIPSADRGGMATALAEAAVVAALSDYEAHPVAVMEALSIARPVVGTTLPA